MQHDSAWEGWQHVAISESLTNRLQASTRVNAEVGVNAEKQPAPLRFAAEAASRGNTREFLHNEIAAEMSEFQYTLSTIVTRVEALENVCSDRLQNREKMWQDVLERVARLENEVAATKPQVQDDAIFVHPADVDSNGNTRSYGCREFCGRYARPWISRETNATADLEEATAGTMQQLHVSNPSTGEVLASLPSPQQPSLPSPQQLGKSSDAATTQVQVSSLPSPLQLEEASDAASGQSQEKWISRLQASIEYLSQEVSELKTFRASGEQHLPQVLQPEEAEQARESTAFDVPISTDQARISMKNVTDRKSTYALQESTWDVVVLIGVPGLSSLASAFVAVVVVINVVMQLFLCFVINDLFTMPEITQNDVTSMRHWRASFGHSTRTMNEFTFEPYARGVCRHVGGIRMHTYAVELLDTIEGYLPSRKNYLMQDPVAGIIMPYISNIGVLLSSIAVLIWVLEIDAALLRSRTKVLALAHTTRAERTIIDLESSHQLKFLTTNRKVFSLLIAAIEVMVLLMLGFGGIWFIIRTLHLRDLILNCSALVIVLDLDELVFTALVPQRVKSLLTSLEELPRPTPPTYFGLSPSSFISMFMILCTMWGTIMALKRQESTLMDVRNEICGGNLNFIAKTDRAGVVSAGFVAQEDKLSHTKKTYAFQAIRQLVVNEAGNVVEHRLSKSDMSSGSSSMDGGPFSLLGWTDTSLGGVMMHWNEKCLDMLPLSNDVYDYANQFLHILRDTLENYEIHECIQVREWCNSDGEKGLRTRQVCPATCGCNDPGPRLILVGDKGCSPTCYSLPEYTGSLWNRTCTDLELDSPYWSQYARSLLGYLMHYESAVVGTQNMKKEAVAELAKAEAGAIAANGCDIVSKRLRISVLGFSWRDPCRAGYHDLKPFAYACPVSCNCTSDNPPPACPKTCRSF